MNLNELTATSPIDGRYRSKTREQAQFFSEYALIKYRVKVEIEYFIALCEMPLENLKSFDKGYFEGLRKIYLNFTIDNAKRVKEIERATNHDVKAVEYFIKEEFEKLGISIFKEFIHFGLTSQDINNTSVPLSIKDCLEKLYYPLINEFIDQLTTAIENWKDVPMLARTHGQPASPTKLGKEIKVFKERIENQLKLLQNSPIPAKFGGATGNFNAHHVTYPDINWVEFGNNFVNKKLGLLRSQTTTQIEHYDLLGLIFDNLKRINTVLIDFARDIWTYISQDYFKQKIKKGEIGSSAMPHKVNPIDFENAEGNLGIANAIFEHLAAKLPVSRLQRDLTDSTVLRNVGVPIAHSEIAIKSLIKGFDKLLLNLPALERDLENNWSVVAEGIQSILRREGYPNPYEALLDLTRTNEKIDKKGIHIFIEGLNISAKVKEELKKITPFNYTGVNLID